MRVAKKFAKDLECWGTGLLERSRSEVSETGKFGLGKSDTVFFVPSHVPPPKGGDLLTQSARVRCNGLVERTMYVSHFKLSCKICLANRVYGPSAHPMPTTSLCCYGHALTAPQCDSRFPGSLLLHSFVSHAATRNPSTSCCSLSPRKGESYSHTYSSFSNSLNRSNHDPNHRDSFSPTTAVTSKTS